VITAAGHDIPVSVPNMYEGFGSNNEPLPLQMRERVIV
jgi:hypothetical protein